jgi:hypothetical protein
MSVLLAASRHVAAGGAMPSATERAAIVARMDAGTATKADWMAYKRGLWEARTASERFRQSRLNTALAVGAFSMLRGTVKVRRVIGDHQIS